MKYAVTIDNKPVFTYATTQLTKVAVIKWAWDGAVEVVAKTSETGENYIAWEKSVRQRYEHSRNKLHFIMPTQVSK
jgi:hypothetical protein